VGSKEWERKLRCQMKKVGSGKEAVNTGEGNVALKEKGLVGGMGPGKEIGFKRTGEEGIHSRNTERGHRIQNRWSLKEN